MITIDYGRNLIWNSRADKSVFDAFFAADVEEFVAEAGDEVQLSCPVKTSGKTPLRLLLRPGFQNFCSACQNPM